MLLLHQVGSVKIGEVVRYTVTYTPSHDRILPAPEVLHLRVRNTSAIALRAAFVHGPYSLSVAAYPSTFNPNTKFEDPQRYGVPEFEPMLKAGGSWGCQLVVPDELRESAGLGMSPSDEGVSWIIEIASQVLFSTSAAVGYEMLLARDEKSLNLNSVPVIGGQAQVPQPGKVSDFQQSFGARDGRHPSQPKGVFSKAVKLKVEDTASLWNTPRLPGSEDPGPSRPKSQGHDAAVRPSSAGSSGRRSREEERPERKKKKVHLVVLTHGLHSNLGADMLYLKESIDATARQAKIDARARRARERVEREAKRKLDLVEEDSEDIGDQSSNQEVDQDDDEDYDEEVIVRGFSGNATRTERGIKYLGKRLSRFILSMTYPDQPYYPSMKAAAGNIAGAIKGDRPSSKEDSPSHKHSTIREHIHPQSHRGYRISSISFIGHSLGGLIQTYAIAYIQKHSPHFFDLIRPVNFITLASPMLGLSNENPIYVKFALDFGLVGRTGQDLGLTWRAPTLARSGWGAIVGTLGESAQKKVMGEVQPESKPLLRILPTGPAHTALKKFRNRTVYSNVVNDGIVPLRTSCLLFLDWQGLGRVEKARREAGLVETLVGFGWAEMMGANVSTARKSPWTPDASGEDTPTPVNASPSPEPEPDTEGDDAREVPQPDENATAEDNRQSLNLVRSYQQQHGQPANSSSNNNNPLSSFFNFFKSSDGSKSPLSKSPSTDSQEPKPKKQSKIYQRSQTLRFDNNGASDSANSSRSRVTSGVELNEETENNVLAPPKTTFFESAGDLLNPKLPTVEFLIDPSHRPRTIFHDRVYHPSDIPPPPLKKRPTGSLAIRRKSSWRSSSLSSKKDSTDSSGTTPKTPDPKAANAVHHEDSSLSKRDYDDPLNTDPDRDPHAVIDSSSMKVEEKIARAYHKGLSWRKVLVKLEPDAHNNIIVRRMFANAHGWPVVKHLCDAHFSDSAAARMRTEDEESVERAKAPGEPPDETGSETKDAKGKGLDGVDERDRLRVPKQRWDLNTHTRTASEAREAEDSVPGLPTTIGLGINNNSNNNNSSNRPGSSRSNGERLDSMTWTDNDWEDSDGDVSESEMDLGYGEGLRPREDREKEEKRRKEKEMQRSSSPSSWNWTEKIVGKGAMRRSREGTTMLSPTTTAGGNRRSLSPRGVGGAAKGKGTDVDSEEGDIGMQRERSVD